MLVTARLAESFSDLSAKIVFLFSASAVSTSPLDERSGSLMRRFRASFISNMPIPSERPMKIPATREVIIWNRSYDDRFFIVTLRLICILSSLTYYISFPVCKLGHLALMPLSYQALDRYTTNINPLARQKNKQWFIYC